MKEKAAPYLGMALLPFAIVALELFVLFIESLVYGTTDLEEVIAQKGVWPSLIHWAITCVVWGAGAWLLYRLSKKRGFAIFENKSKAPLINWIIVFVLLILSVVSSYLAWETRFKPAAEFGGMVTRFGGQAVLAFVGQYVYYLFESVLFTAIVVFGQKFGEAAFKKNNIPWGGFLCGATWGLGHILTQDLFTGVFAAAISISYGVVYLLLKRNVRYTFPVLALMFML